MAIVTNFLNKEQEAVAENTRDNLLLLAGAGTGKTGTLACRVANLLTADAAAPDEILCLTFTNRACKEMTERIEAIAGSAAREVVVRTIHSFCALLLRQTPHSLVDIGQDFTVCDADDCRELLREVVFETAGRELAERPAAVLQRFIGLVKDCQLDHPSGGGAGACAFAFLHRRDALERICVDAQYHLDTKFYTFLSKYGASILRLYNLKLTGANMLDFSDLLLRADALLTDPATAPLWRERFRYVHMDEVQDVSLAEYTLLMKLCKRAVVLLCGDFNQTIYQWRGSDPDALTDRFKQDFHPLIVEFTVNYRSSAQLLAISKNFLRNAFDLGAGGGLDPFSPACTDLVVAEFETMPEEVDWIYRQIAALDVTDYSRVAIITRTNKVCADVCSILKASRLTAEKPVRFMLADEFRLFKRAEVKDLLACVNLLVNPRDSESLRRVLTRLVAGVGSAAVAAVVGRYKEGLGVALTDFADPRTASGDYFEPLLAALEHQNVVVFDVESTGTDVFSDDIVQLAAIRLDADGAELARFERFLRPSKPVGASESVHGFSDAFLAENGDAPADALTAFLDFAGGAVLVGHNVGFDMQITAQNLLRAGVPRALDNLYYDTLDLSRRFLKKLENHKLSTVAEALGAGNDPTHNAMDDILATADVLTALVNRYLTPQNEPRRQCYAKYLPRFAAFAATVASLQARADTLDAPALTALLSDTFGVAKRYENDPEKTANLLLFSDFAEDFTDRSAPPRVQLAALLELIALSAGALESMSKTANKVAVITAHQAKGCEFDYVFLPVLQESVFPAYQAIKADRLGEEKRVFYVSITRAKRKLFLSWAHYGLNQYHCKPSRFLSMLGA